MMGSLPIEPDAGVAGSARDIVGWVFCCWSAVRSMR